MSNRHPEGGGRSSQAPRSPSSQATIREEDRTDNCHRSPTSAWAQGWQDWSQGWSSDQWGSTSNRHLPQEAEGWSSNTGAKKIKSPANILRSKLRAQVKRQFLGTS